MIYSDGCTYQNRNAIIANALLHFANKHNIDVEQKYLVKGHTNMECDSVHACIERKLKNRDVHVPADYVTATKEAREKPFPYEVKYLSYDFFKDFTVSSLQYYESIRPGRKSGDPVLTDVSCLKYTSSGILYKLEYDDEYQILPQRLMKVDKKIEAPALFSSVIPLKFSKWKHLQELKSVIPSDFHSYYDNLPHLESDERSGRKSKSKPKK